MILIVIDIAGYSIISVHHRIYCDRVKCQLRIKCNCYTNDLRGLPLGLMSLRVLYESAASTLSHFSPRKHDQPTYDLCYIGYVCSLIKFCWTEVGFVLTRNNVAYKHNMIQDKYVNIINN